MAHEVPQPPPEIPSLPPSPPRPAPVLPGQIGGATGVPWVALYPPNHYPDSTTSHDRHKG